MQRDRSKAIGVELNEIAKKIYDNLPKHIKKGEFLSDAIIEKNARENNTSISDQIKSAIEEHVRIYHRKDD